MVVIISAEDLPSSVTEGLDPDLLDLLIAGANARATRVAPCLGEEPTADQLAEARMVLVGAVQRWAEAGAGAYQQQTAGPFSVSYDTRQRTGFNLWPSEVTDLQAICAGDAEVKKAFMIDLTTPADVATGVDPNGTGIDFSDRPDLQFQYGWPGA